MFERVVVGVTESERGRAAVARAADVVRQSGGHLHLVTAVTARRPEAPPMPEEFDYSVGSIDPADWLLQQLATEAEVNTEVHTVLDDPADALLRVAREQRADLIVVGSSRPGTLPRTGVSGTVLNKASCAVLVV